MQHKVLLKKIGQGLAISVLLCLLCGISFWGGYYQAVGTLPFFGQESVMPPETTHQTFDDVASFIETDNTSVEDYGEGMNCVDFAFAMARKAQWQGLSPEIVKIDLIEGESHVMLMFNTSDKGLVFIEPQTDKEFSPFMPGDHYGQKIVSGVYVMAFQWIPFSKYLKGGNTTDD